MNGPLFVLVRLLHVYENLWFIYFWNSDSLLSKFCSKTGKNQPKIVKNDVIFGNPLPPSSAVIILKPPPSLKPMTSFVNDP